MHTDAIICSSLPSVNSAEYALKMHLDSRIYNNAGDEMKSFFDTLVELNHYLSQGQYYIKMLYSYRGTSNTVPLKVPKEDENNADRQNEYRQALFLLLRTETMKISDLMKFCEKSMTLFKKILDDVNIYQENYTTYPEEILLAIVHFVDMIVKIDALKDLKTCLKNDFALYKRTFYLIKDQLKEAAELSNEINQIQMFLSNPMHNKHYVLTMIRSSLLQCTDGRYETVFLALISLCMDKSDELFDKNDSIEKSVVEFSCDQRYCPIRVLPHLYVLLDGLIGENGDAINVFEMKKYKFDKSADKIFKNLPVIPLMFEMVIEIHPTLQLCLNYKESGFKICKKVFKLNQKNINQFYSLVSNDNVKRIIEKEDILCKYMKKVLLNVENEEKNAANKKKKKKKGKKGTGSSAGNDDAALARRELFINVFKAFHHMGDASTTVLTHIGWKYANPSSTQTTGKNRKNSINRDNNDSVVNENNREYARRILYNYSSEEKDVIINLIGSTKNLANVLLKNEDYIRVEIRKHIHTLLQQFVQESLPSMLRKAYKAKKMESVELMLQLRRIVCDWNGNNGEEPDNLYELKKKDRKNHLYKFEWKNRLAIPSLTQIIVLRHILGTLFHQSSESMKSDQGVVFKSRLFTNEDVSKMEVLYDLSKYFYQMLTYHDTIKELSSFSTLWYREFYLEICKESQFPITLSMPWILVEHIIFTPNTPNMKFIYNVLDIYNDAANEALHTLGQQYLYNEVEGEMNLVFDQLLYMLNRHLYTYYKNIATSLQDETTYRKLNPYHRFYSRSKEKNIWSEQFMAGKNRIFKNESYDKIRNTSNLMLLGRKLNLSKILSAALEREMIRDLEKCFQDLEQHDICGIIRFEGLINALMKTHSTLTSSLGLSNRLLEEEGKKDNHSKTMNILNFLDLVNAVNESVSIHSNSSEHLGRISTYIIKELYNTLLPNMVYITADSKKDGETAKSFSSFVYTRKHGNIVNKHTGQTSNKVHKTYEKIRKRRHSVVHNINNVKQQSKANQDKNGDDNNTAAGTNVDITKHFRFGNTAHANLYEKNYLKCEFFFSEIHTRSLMSVTNNIIGNVKANKMYGILFKMLSLQMEEKMIPYIMALLPGVKPVILPSYKMKTNVNYLSVEGTVKGFLRYNGVNNKVFKGIQEIGNALVFLKMLDCSFHNLEYDNINDDVVDGTSSFDASYVGQKSKKKKRNNNKKESDSNTEEYRPKSFFDNYISKNMDKDQNNGNNIATEKANIKYSFLKRGLLCIQDALNRDLNVEKDTFNNIPLLFASLLFILCRPNMNDGNDGSTIRSADLYEEYGEGLLFGCISILHCLKLKDVLMEKSYNKHIINVHLFDQAIMEEEKKTKKDKKNKSKNENRRNSIGTVDKKTEDEIRAYLTAATKVEELISSFSKFFDEHFQTLKFVDEEKESKMQLGNVTPKRIVRKVPVTAATQVNDAAPPSAIIEKRQVPKEEKIENQPKIEVNQVQRVSSIEDPKDTGNDQIEDTSLVLQDNEEKVGTSTVNSSENNLRFEMEVENNKVEDVETNNVELQYEEVEEEEEDVEEEDGLDAVCMVYVLYDYEAENDDELNLTEGSFVMVTELGSAEDADWWRGFLKDNTSKYGTFPKNYVSLMLQYENNKYLISTDTNEVYKMDDMEECLGVFDDATYFLTDINGEEQDWTSAVLL